jgi:hypothetical protein
MKAPWLYSLPHVRRGRSHAARLSEGVGVSRSRASYTSCTCSRVRESTSVVPITVVILVRVRQHEAEQRTVGDRGDGRQFPGVVGPCVEWETNVDQQMLPRRLDLYATAAISRAPR